MNIKNDKEDGGEKVVCCDINVFLIVFVLVVLDVILWNC